MFIKSTQFLVPPHFILNKRWRLLLLWASGGRCGGITHTPMSARLAPLAIASWHSLTLRLVMTSPKKANRTDTVDHHFAPPLLSVFSHRGAGGPSRVRPILTSDGKHWLWPWQPCGASPGVFKCCFKPDKGTYHIECSCNRPQIPF